MKKWNRLLFFVFTGLTLFNSHKSSANCRSRSIESLMPGRPSYVGCHVLFDSAMTIFPASLVPHLDCETFCSSFEKNLRELDEQFQGIPSESTSGQTNTLQTYGWINGDVDITEGFGAFDDILSFFQWRLGPKNLDLGGGRYNHTSAYLRIFGIENWVLDPFGRTMDHNLKVLQQFGTFQTVTSISVLNVIETQKEIHLHIQQAFDALESKGVAFFKIYEGDLSGQRKEFQNNAPTEHYLSEIQAVFGWDRVESFPHHFLIVATKP